MSSTRRAFLGGLGATLALAAARGTARADASIKVASAVTPPSMHNLYLHVAHERGFFKKHGATVSQFLQLRGGPLATQALVSGEADVTATDPEGVLAAVVAGHPIRAVSAPGERLSYVIAVRKEIRSIADLRGKPFAVSRPGAISQYLLFPELDRAGIPRNEVQWLSVGGGRERMLALLANRVAGALLHLDFALQALKDPNIHSLGTLAETFPDYPFELLVVREALIKEQPELVVGITAAVIEACRFILSDKQGTLEVFRKYSGIDPAQAAEAYDALVKIKGFGANGGLTPHNAQVAMRMAVENKQIPVEIPLDRWVDLRFQEAALERLGRFPG